jgi:hypothetical protein
MAALVLAVGTGVVVIVVAIAVVLIMLLMTLSMRGRQKRRATTQRDLGRAEERASRAEQDRDVAKAQADRRTDRDR